MKLIFLFYNWWLSPIFWLLSRILFFLWPAKIQKLLQLQSKPWPEKSSRQKKYIWIHAASGEIEYARSVARSIKKQTPDIAILLTYTSPSIIPLLEKITTDFDLQIPLPWDQTLIWKHFIEKYQPHVLLIARSDLWPALIYQCNKMHVPAYLFSATFRNISLWQKWNLSMLAGIFCVSTEDQQIARKNGIACECIGDTRYDQVLYRLQNSEPLPDFIHQYLQQFSNIFLAGSTWPEDEAHIIPWICFLQQRSVFTIIAPHETHLNHIQNLTAALNKNNIPFILWSDLLKLNTHFQKISFQQACVLVVDRVGILAELYKYSQVAFVGGSFRKKVHSVMEPLAAGNMVLVGPYHHNNREALEAKKIEWDSKTQSQLKLVNEVLNHQDMIQTSEEFLNSAIKKSVNLDSFVQTRTGATAKLLQKITSNWKE